MAYCLIPKLADQFKQDMIDGKIDPTKLALMTSVERRAFFAEKLGKDNARDVNALFESKLLLKNQQAGMISWAKKVIGISKATQTDLIAKINRLDKALTPTEQDKFLEDLVSKRLGTDITYEEAGKIAELAKTVEETKVAIPENSPIDSSERMKYGFASKALTDYVREIKTQTGKIDLAEFKNAPLKTTVAVSKDLVTEIPGMMKSAKTTLDNSYFGRQGWLVFATDPGVWAKKFANSWVNIGKQLMAKTEGGWWKSGNDAVMDTIEAGIVSRPNALNGKYKAGNFGLDVSSEEAYPTEILESIPVLGRLAKTSQVAYNAGALEMRADLADKIIKQAEEFGVNMSNPEEAKPVGQVVSSLTGRGSIGKLGVVGKEINVFFFAIRYLKGNIDVLTKGVSYPIQKTLEKAGLYEFENKGYEFAAKKSATNLVKIIGVMASILAIAEFLMPGSVEKDPRGGNFGKIKIGNKTYNISAGLGNIINLASRITPTKHDGEWGFWTKNSNTGVYTKLNTTKYGARTALDVIDQFWQGKLSPFVGIFRDMYAGQNYQGQPVTPKNIVSGATVPMPIENFQQFMNNPDQIPVLINMIIDGLGTNVQTIIPPKPKKSTTKRGVGRITPKKATK